MKKIRQLFLLLSLLLCAVGARAQSELTVYEGTNTSNVVPAYVFYFDDFTKSQFVIPAEDLADMAGGTINSIRFHVSPESFQSIPYTSESTVDVYLMEVGYTSISAYEPKANATIVYQGQLNFDMAGENGILTISFDSPFIYNGGNLLIGIENTTNVNYKSIRFLGQTVNGASIGGSNGTSLNNVPATQRNFIPMTTFIYEPSASLCARPTDLVVENITTNSAIVNWSSDADLWTLQYKGPADADWIEVTDIDRPTYTLTGLAQNSSYQVRVQSVCDKDETSGWTSSSFTTLASCLAPTNVTVSNITSESATVTWESDAEQWALSYKLSSASVWTEVSVSGSPSYTLTGLTSPNSYNVRVRAICSDTDYSDWTEATSFSIPVGLPYLQEFSNTSLPSGWTRYNGLLADVLAGTANLQPSTGGWGFGARSGVFDSHAYSNIYGSNNRYWLVTPSVVLDGDVELTFDIALTAYSGTAQPAQTNGTDDKFAVLITTDGGNTWSVLRQWDNAGSDYVLNSISTTGQNVLIDLWEYSGQTIALAFYSESTSSNADNYIHLDNVSIDYPAACPKPTDVAVSNITATTADISWMSSAYGWQIGFFDGDEVTRTINIRTEDLLDPYPITGLTPETTYKVALRTICDNAIDEPIYSDWTLPVTFTTLVACEKPTNVAVANVEARSAVISWEGTSDSYLVLYQVDGATGWEIQTVDEETVTLSGLNPATSYYFLVKGDCGEFQSQSVPGTFTTLESCVTPTDLAVTPTPYSATVSWNGTNDGYNLRYREVPLSGMAAVTLTADDVWGDGSGYQMLLDSDATTYGTIIPETGGLTSSGDAGASVYGAFEYKIPENADGELTTSHILNNKSMTILIPAGTYDWCITNPTPGDRVWIASGNGNVGGRQDDFVFEANKLYEFHVSLGGNGNDLVDVTITDVVGSGDSDADAWTNVNNANNPYNITGLSPETLYEVQVQGDCGDEQSKWISKYFVTLSDCPVPTDVAVDPEVTTANVTWEGYNDKYNLKYRKAASTQIVFSDGFESGYGQWQRVDCEITADGQTGIYSGEDYCHSGDYFFGFLYNTNPPQYLISPELNGVTEGMTLEFYYRAVSSDYLESFKVGYSSTTDDISAFTWGDEITTTSTSYQLFSEAIPAGTKYFCVQYTANDQFYLFVDDFSVGVPVDAGEWTTIEGIEDTEYELTGLEPDTRYELQVQGVCDESETDWSEMVPFTTLYASLVLLNDDLDEDVKNSDKLTEALGKKVNVTLEGRTFFKDGNWNSLYLPFDVTEEMIADENNPLYGATIKAISAGSVTGNHVDITFSSDTQIEAGYWYIFKWNEGEDIVNPVFKNVEIVDKDPYYYVTIDNGHFTVYGNYDSFPIDPSVDGCYTYYLTSNGQMKYSDKYRVLKTFRIFFRFSVDNDDAGALEFNLNFDDGDTQTGIVELDGNGRGNRAPEGYYNLQGVKYNGKPIQKGVYINNGQKVVVK